MDCTTLPPHSTQPTYFFCADDILDAEENFDDVPDSGHEYADLEAAMRNQEADSDQEEEEEEEGSAQGSDEDDAELQSGSEDGSGLSDMDDMGLDDEGGHIGSDDDVSQLDEEEGSGDEGDVNPFELAEATDSEEERSKSKGWAHDVVSPQPMSSTSEPAAEKSEQNTKRGTSH